MIDRRTTLKGAVLALTVLTAGAAHAQDKVPDKIKVGIEGAFPPWNATEADGSLSGMDIDLIEDLCARADLECELVPGPWSGMIPSLNAGKYDAIMTIGINDERKKVIDFTTPYASGVASFLVPADSALTDMPMTGELLNLNEAATADPVMKEIAEMLDGKTVGVVGSTSQERLIEAYFGDEVEVRTYESSGARDLDLKSGRLDAGFDSGVYETAMLAKEGNDDLAMAGPLLRGAMLATSVAIGVRKGEDALRDRLSDAIRSAADDGTIREMSQKWSQLDLTPEPAE